MKAKLIFSIETKNTEYWKDLPFIPRLNEWLNIPDILKQEEVSEIKKSAHCWSGIRGMIKSVEYRQNDNNYYVEIYVLCDDFLINQRKNEKFFQCEFALNLVKIN